MLVYDVNLGFVSQGRQEDAEEYLGFILNGLHEEMVALKKLISPEEESMFFFDFCTCYNINPSLKGAFRLAENILCECSSE